MPTGGTDGEVLAVGTPSEMPVGGGTRRLPGTDVFVRCTSADDGDQRELGRGRPVPSGVPPLPVLTAHQVHGATVLVDPAALGPAALGPAAGGVTVPWSWWHLELDRPADGDAVVSRGVGRAVAVLTADCVPLVVGTAAGVFAAVHVGWRGLVAGVVEATAAVVEAAGGRHLVAVLGPAIGPCCYAFSEAELARVLACTAGVGRASTRTGDPALDLPAAVRSVAARCGITVSGPDGPCTACAGGFYSHRARRQDARQATIAWLGR